ncbi:MAG: hypothetical protein IPL23_29395 [Saprospiraceae bacterium]|nr:hypothetical protein [Saprospiraceae bacterium]MBK8635953.1 hypothetical protein [Saprospiraceae bacterium]MBP7642485.1 hypothetical protein [Saprospiraceae bacterium]
MGEIKEIKNAELLKEANEIVKIGNKAVKKAIEENKKYNLPEIKFIKGQIYFISENGDLIKKEDK